MMFIDMPKSKVYALVDAQGRITRIDGGYTMGNIGDITAWTQIDEGFGDRYNLCQSNYLGKPLRDERGIFRYKLVNGDVVERTAEEMDADCVPPAASVDEAALLRAQVQALTERGEFLEDCIAEMAMMVYGDA